MLGLAPPINRKSGTTDIIGLKGNESLRMLRLAKAQQGDKANLVASTGTCQGNAQASTSHILLAQNETKSGETGEANQHDSPASRLGRFNFGVQFRMEGMPNFKDFAREQLKSELDKKFPGRNFDPSKIYVVNYEDKIVPRDGRHVHARITIQARPLINELIGSVKYDRTPTYTQNATGIYLTPDANGSDPIEGGNGLIKAEEAIDDAKFNLKHDFQNKLNVYWGEPIENGIARKEMVARDLSTALKQVAAIGEQDGSLTKEDVARVSKLAQHPGSAERVDDDGRPKPEMPGVYAISIPNKAEPGSKIEFSGMYIISEKPIAGEIDADADVGTVLLSSPGRPLERFDSLNALNADLSLRLADPEQRQLLLKHVPVEKQDRIADAGTELDESVSFGYQPIQGNVFANRIQSMIDQQLNDVGTGENVEAAVRDKLNLEPYLVERDQLLMEQAQRDSWPDWRKHASESDQNELAEYESVKQSALESADWLLEDVESPQAYGRDKATQYLKEKFGIDANPNEIQIRARYTTPTGPQERHATLLEFLQEGPRDTNQSGVTYTVDQQGGSGTHLTDVQLKQTLGELDVRKDYSIALEASYQNSEVKDTLSDVLDSEIQMDAFSAKMRGHLSQEGYDLVQRMRDSRTGATTQVNMGGLSINLPGKGADQMRDVLVFHEKNAAGQVERYVLYAPNSPDGKDFYEFSNWNTLSSTVCAWTKKSDGRQYLQDQLEQESRSNAAYFFQDTALRADAWSSNEGGTATWNELQGSNYRNKLDAAVAEKNRTRTAEAKVGTISPDWYRNATATERQQLTNLADRVRATKQALPAALPEKPFAEYAQEKVKKTLNDYLAKEGMTEAIDPDTVMVDLGDGASPRTLTNVAMYGYDSSVNFVSSARFTSSTGQDLGPLNASVVGHEQGAGRKGAFAAYMDPYIRGAYLGEEYTREIETKYLSDKPVLESRRALYREHVQSTMQYDALQAKLKGELTAAEYASVKLQIDSASMPNARSPGTRSLHRLTFNGRPVDGVYVFRGVGEVGQARDWLYTPGAPDGRTFRLYDAASFRPGKDESWALKEAMADYFDSRVKYSDQRVANTRFEKLQSGEEKPDTLDASHQVPNLDREYDRKLELALDPVKETTKTRGQVISENVWKGVNYAGSAFSILYPPAGITFGLLMWGKEMHDAYQAYRRGDRASASLSILGAGAEALGVAFDALDGLKALGGGLTGVRKTLGLQPGQHFGSVEDAAKALRDAEIRSSAKPFFKPPTILDDGRVGYLAGPTRGPRLPNTTANFGSSRENIGVFEIVLNTTQRPIVHFPPSARGDMNAYKYTAFIDEKDRPLTVFEYFNNPRPGSEQEAFNRNLDSIKQHLSSLKSKLKEGRDYIFGTQNDVNKFKKLAGEVRVKHYQEYDNIMSNLDVRKEVHAMFRGRIKSDPKIMAYLERKLPLTDVAAGNQRRESKLIVININKRASQQKWDPREYRHTTPSDADMQSLIDGIYDAKNSIKGKDKLDIGFVGNKFGELEQQSWIAYGQAKGVDVHFFNDMVDEGLDRTQQRAALFALSDRYKSTTYLGHQSGVNEDAQILPRTNVYSLSENLGQGQVGISRIEARPQLDIVRWNPLGIATGANNMGNFYSLRNTEFLTTEGILAAVQIKLNLKSTKHRSLDDLWKDLTDYFTSTAGREFSDVSDAEIVDVLFNMILKDAEIPLDVIEGKEALENYRSAIGVIVRRKKTGESGLSQEAKLYFTNAMKKELSPHDSQDPITRHDEKIEAHNEGMQPYKLGNKEINNRRRESAHNYDNYLEWLFSTVP